MHTAVVVTSLLLLVHGANSYKWTKGSDPNSILVIAGHKVRFCRAKLNATVSLKMHIISFQMHHAQKQSNAGKEMDGWMMV